MYDPDTYLFEFKRILVKNIPMKESNKFGKWLREARQGAGVSLAELVDIIGYSLRELGMISNIDYSMLSRVEQGDRFLSDEKIIRLAHIFDADPKQLISLKFQDKKARALKQIGKGPKFIPGFRPDIETEVFKFLKIYREKRKINKIIYPLELRDFFELLFGLEIRYESFSEKQLWKKGEEPALAALFVQSKTIIINTDPIGGRSLPIANQRFSLAHEGAHFIDSLKAGETPSKPIYFRRKQLRRNNEETTIDYWAGAILMPKSDLVNKVEKLSKQRLNNNFIANLSIIGNDLCDYFGVSRQALEIRLKQIGINCINTHY